LFGAHEEADARLSKCALHPHCSTVEAEILGTRLTYKIAAPAAEFSDRLFERSAREFRRPGFSRDKPTWSALALSPRIKFTLPA